MSIVNTNNGLPSVGGITAGSSRAIDQAKAQDMHWFSASDIGAGQSISISRELSKDISLEQLSEQVLSHLGYFSDMQ